MASEPRKLPTANALVEHGIPVGHGQGFRNFYFAGGVYELNDMGHVFLRERPVAEVEAERDKLVTVLRDVGGHLDYLRELWGDEAITRQVADRIRGALAGLAPGGEGRGGGGG